MYVYEMYMYMYMYVHVHVHMYMYMDYTRDKNNMQATHMMQNGRNDCTIALQS